MRGKSPLVEMLVNCLILKFGVGEGVNVFVMKWRVSLPGRYDFCGNFFTVRVTRERRLEGKVSSPTVSDPSHDPELPPRNNQVPWFETRTEPRTL